MTSADADFWRRLWNEKGQQPTDFQATGRGGMDVPGFLHTVREVVRILGLDRGHDLLDVGCGTGVFALALCPWIKSVHGVDIAETVVERARRNLLGIENASFEVGSITDLPCPGAAYDRVLAYSVLQYLAGEAEAAHALGELARVLRPGGLALLAANPDPARRHVLVDAINAKPDPEMRRIELELLDKTLWLAPARWEELAAKVGLSARAIPISERIWQHFYMFDLVVTKHG